MLIRLRRELGASKGLLLAGGVRIEKLRVAGRVKKQLPRRKLLRGLAMAIPVHHVHIHTYIYIYIYTRTYIHTYIHTCILTHMLILNMPPHLAIEAHHLDICRSIYLSLYEI